MNLVSPENLPRQNLVLLVMNRMKDWIASGHLKPGDRLPSETELVKLFSVSKPVIREAISRLNALKIIETYHGRGSFVSEAPNSLYLTTDEVTESDALSRSLWELRSIFEPAVAELAAENCLPEDIVHLEEVLVYMRSALDRGDNGVIEDDRFHLITAQATHNPLVVQMAVQIARLAEPYKRLSLRQPFRSEETYKELIEILAALKSKQRLAASSAMINHIKNSQNSIPIEVLVDRRLS